MRAYTTLARGFIKNYSFFLNKIPFIIKVYNSGVSRWKKCIEQGGWKGAQILHDLNATFPDSPSVHQSGSYGIQSFWIFMEALLHCHDFLNHWSVVVELNLQPLPEARMGVGLSYNSNDYLVPQAARPDP